MKCPDCGEPYKCNCDPCVERLGPGWPRSEETANTWNETCAKCGKTQDVHLWMDEEFKQIAGRDG